MGKKQNTLDQDTVGSEVKTKQCFKKRVKKVVMNKYFWVVIAVILISAVFIVLDMKRRHGEERPQDVNKDQLIMDAAKYMSAMESGKISSEVDIFLKQTKGIVTKPYMVGQSVEFTVCKKDPFMIHGDGNIVFQENGQRTSRIYERYETIGEEITDAYDNKDDLIWSKKQYYNVPDITESVGLFDLISDNRDTFKATRLFKVNGRECYQLEGELQYADMLPYLKTITCFRDADMFLDEITRNGFYAFVYLYIDCQTGLPARLYIDFADVARAFAEVDGKNEGYECQISTFYFKMDYSEYNKIDNIEIDLSVKDNAIDELMFWERLRNNDLTYEEFVFYVTLFNISKDDFDFYMKKMKCTDSEYNTFLALFNFDEKGHPVLPKLTESEFKYMKEMFRTDKGYKFYQKALGISQKQYRYYLNFFANIKKYGNFKMFDKMTKSQYNYYKGLLGFSGYNYSTYKATTTLLGGNKGKNIQKVSKQRFDAYMDAFKAGKGYKWFRDKYKWTKDQYNSYKQIYDFMQAYYGSVLKDNPDIKSWYAAYEMIVKFLKQYNKNINDFSYSQNEFLYYAALNKKTDSYVSYKEYIDSQQFANGTLEYFKRLYKVISAGTSRFKDFNAFYAYASSTDYQAFIKEFNLDTYVSDYDDKVGVDAENHSGVDEGGELSDKWYSYSFKYSSRVIGLPVSYSDFVEATAYSMGGKEDLADISAGATISKTLYKNGNKDTMTVLIKNDSGSTKKINKCNITSISISSSLSGSEISKILLPSGIKIGSSYDTVKTKYGKPYSSSNNSSGKYLVYRSSAKNQNMKLTFYDNKLSKVTFTYAN